jgi:hypothetical protein
MTELGSAMAGALPERLISAPSALGVTVSGGKWSGGGGLPHLGFDGHGEAATCSHDNELLRCSLILGVDGAQVILWLRREQSRTRGCRRCFSSRWRDTGGGKSKSVTAVAW